MNNPNTQLPPGTLLQNGKYRIMRTLGKGGFGITYEVEQTMLKVRYAIKEFFVSSKDVYCRRDTTYSNMVSPQFDKALYEKLKNDFIKEARTLLKLDNIPNVVKVRDTFEENETVYIVMDFVEGMSLGQMIKKRGVLQEYQVRYYMRQVVEALKQVHQCSILHRDIKPDNILIRPDDTAVIIDFGISRHFVHDKTQFHTTMLSVGYAPPEQEYSTARKGAYSDLYSVGATMYYCLSQKIPQTLTELNFQDYVSVQELNPHVSDDLNRIINKALEKKPPNRYQNSDALLEDLNAESTVINNAQHQNSDAFLEDLNAESTVINNSQHQEKIVVKESLGTESTDEIESCSLSKRLAHAFLDNVILVFVFTLNSYSILGKLDDFFITALFWVVFIAYYFISELVAQQTLAKVITKTVVVTKEGDKPKFGQILGRTLVRLIPFEWLPVFWKKKTLHDIISGTVVVDKDSIDIA